MVNYVFNFRSFGFENQTPVDKLPHPNIDNGDSGHGGSVGDNCGRPKVNRKRPSPGDVSPIMPGGSGMSRRRLEFK